MGSYESCAAGLSGRCGIEKCLGTSVNIAIQSRSTITFHMMTENRHRIAFDFHCMYQSSTQSISDTRPDPLAQPQRFIRSVYALHQAGMTCQKERVGRYVPDPRVSTKSLTNLQNTHIHFPT